MSKRFNERVVAPGAGDPVPPAPIPTSPVGPATSTRTVVPSNNVSGTLLNSNANRRGATVFNNSTANLFLALGPNAATTNFTLKMATGSYYEVPFGYTGIITGVWDAVNGNAQVTELTP